MKLNKIERAARTILAELKSGAFSRNELVKLNALFTKVVEITSKMLKKIDEGS